jgi:predicted lipoprotein with Yx(FWY)xxD motif
MMKFRIGAASSLVIVAGLAGCGTDETAGEAGEMGMSDTGMPSRVAEANYMPSGTYMRESPEGQIMTTPDGMTVYTFDQDTAGASSCYGECAEEWPPVTAPSDAQPFGNLSIIERTDGTRQWAHAGMPLYLYHDDAAPGDTEGDGEGGVWHVVR